MWKGKAGSDIKIAKLLQTVRVSVRLKIADTSMSF